MKARVALAFDFGLKRIGIASGDTLTRTASPRNMIPVHAAGPDWTPCSTARCVRTRPTCWWSAPRIMMMVPRRRIAAAADAFAAQLAKRYGLPVERVDERYSSTAAASLLREQRAAGSRRKAVRKGDIDSAAAAIMLQSWLTQPKRIMTSQRRADGSLGTCSPSKGSRATELTHAARTLAALRARAAANARRQSDALAGVTVANMFTEPSTRTRVSFELAAKRLGADVVNLELQLSSRVKGESMLDTVFTLESLHVDVFVLRDAEVGVPAHGGRQCGAACERAVGRRGASVASHAGPARCAHRAAAQEALRRALHRDRRRHPAFARGALGAPGASRRSASATCASSRRLR